jgi:hypothetical protein
MTSKILMMFRFFILDVQIMPDEIQEHDLMDLENQELEQENFGNPDQQMQLGFVEISKPEADPVFFSRSKQKVADGLPATIYKSWAQHFAPGPGSPAIKVPAFWAPFFTAMLMNPGSIEWANSFLSSDVVNLLAQSAGPSSGEATLNYSLPSACPKMEGLFSSYRKNAKKL